MFDPIAERGQREPVHALTHGHLIRGLDAEGQGEGTTAIGEAWRWRPADGTDGKRATFNGSDGMNHVPLLKVRLKGLGRKDRTCRLFADEMIAME